MLNRLGQEDCTGEDSEDLKGNREPCRVPGAFQAEALTRKDLEARCPAAPEQKEAST